MSAAARPQSLPPRIALVRGRYDAGGGAERFVQRAIASLKAEGASVTVVARQWPDNDGTAMILDPFHVGSLWRDWSFARAACAALGRRRFDLVQSHERIACCDVYRAGDGVHAQWLAERARVQSAAARLATRLDPHHRFVLAAERAVFTAPRVRAVICNSEMVRREIAAHYGTSGDKLVLVRNAVDSEHFHPGLRADLRASVRQQLAIPANANVVLHVGSGFERKGVAAFLQAVAGAGDRWAIVVGRDKHAARYHARAAALGVAARVRFVGAVSDVRPYYAAADSFLLATLYDPQPNAMLEAMACGLPVLTTPKCGAAELVVEGESGFVRDALDTAGMAQALAGLEPGRARTMGEAARAAVARFTPQAMAQEYLALYHRLLRR